MESPVAASSELQGSFRGFFKDIFGKRRLVLQVAGENGRREELYLKIPKDLRKELDGWLIVGQQVLVTCHEELEGPVVSDVQKAEQGRGSHAGCTVRVCAKKNCWRDGGKEFWHEMERQIDASGLDGRVKLKAVGCLDHCKKGPNAECAGRDYHHCSPEVASKILAPFIRQQAEDETKKAVHAAGNPW